MRTWDKVLFPESGWRKRDVVDYYLSVADAAVVHLRERPCVLKRFPNGVAQPFFFQKRTPKTYEWLETAIVTFPSGRHAEEVVIQDAAHLDEGDKEVQHAVAQLLDVGVLVG